MKCPKCNEKVSSNFCFCPKCGFMYQKPKISITKGKMNRPGKSKVDQAFDNLGLDKKMLKEQGLTKEKILSELSAGVKPKEEVMQGGDVGKLGKLEKE